MPQKWILLSLILILGLYSRNASDQSRLMEEICDNAADDDNDGLIDLNDPDCICEMVSLTSLVPNPSFEDYNCCPNSDSQLRCADEWDQASTATTDYLHSCGYLAVGQEMLPFPDGEGAVLFLNGTVDNGNGPEIYKEYAGVCLNRPMEKDSIYQFKLHLGFLNQTNSPQINLSFFGSPSCANLPFAQAVDCPINYPDWYFLRSQMVSGDSDSPIWVEVSIDLEPSMDINALVIGGDCSHDLQGLLRIYFLDNLRLNDKSNFDFDLLDKGSPCDPDFVFAVTDDARFSYQWYKEGVAIVGEIEAQLSQMYGEGFYQLRILNRATQECRIADDFEFTIPVYKYEDFETLCEGESLLYNGEVIEEVGIYEYTFASVDGCDSIVTLNVARQPNKVDTIYAQTLLGTPYTLGDYQFQDEGEYVIQFATAEGCDSTLVLYLENINVFIPNIFSPNGDNINDYFEIITSGDDITTTELSIFDRWGNLVYVGDRWDGTHNNELVASGVFVYFAKLINREGEKMSFSGSITVIR